MYRNMNIYRSLNYTKNKVAKGFMKEKDAQKSWGI